MKILKRIGGLILLSLFIINTFFVGNALSSENKQIEIVYFYFNACPSCNIVEKKLEEIQKYADYNNNKNRIKIIMYEVTNQNNYGLLLKYFDLYNIPDNKRILPIVFIGNTYLSGEAEIQSNLKGIIKENNLPETIRPLNNESKDNLIKDSFLKMNYFTVFLTGLVNGLNPCGLSMILFFLSILVSQDNNVLKSGLYFCLGKLLMYFLLGTIIFSFLSKINIPLYNNITKIILIIALVTTAILNFRDYYYAKHEDYGKINMQLPKFLRKIDHGLIKKLKYITNSKFIVIFSFLLGMIISIGEFLCTGQIYLTTIIYFIQNNSKLNKTALIYFTIYNISLIIPLVIIVLVLNKTKDMFNVSNKLRGKLPMIKLITSFTFIIFAILFLL